MSEKSEDTLANDLAFLKGLVGEGSRAEMSGGIVFLGAGIIYGVQCLIQWINLMGWIHLNGPGNIAVGALPTVALLILVFWVSWRDRKNGPKGVATRALNAAFSSAGLANLFIVAVIAYVAITEKSFVIWALYPAVICAMQGAVWYTAYMIRRKLWLAFVSAGWFATTLALGALVRSPHYVLVIGLALLFLMGGSGYTMMRLAKKRLG